MRPNPGLFGITGALPEDPVFGGIWQFPPSCSSFLAHPLLLAERDYQLSCLLRRGILFSHGLEMAGAASGLPGRHMAQGGQSRPLGTNGAVYAEE